MILFDGEWFGHLDEVLRADPEYRLISRGVDVRVGFLVDDRDISVRFADGGVGEALEPPRLQTGWAFGFQADHQTWNTFVAEVPSPPYQDIFAMISAVPNFRLLGDRLRFLQHGRVMQMATRHFRAVLA